MACVKTVLIVGGGIAGQALGCALARRGIQCEIVELRPNFQLLGAAMTFQGTALRALFDIDLTQQVIDAALDAITKQDVLSLGSVRRVAIIGPRTSNMRDVPAPSLMTRYINSSSTPARSASTNASAVDRL